MLDFKLMLERQKDLDSKIKGIRKRDMTDILLSFKAEVIEFNETLGIHSHKTWKSIQFTREQQLDEYVDMLFFLMQFLNNKKEEEQKNILEKFNENWKFNSEIFGLREEIYLLSACDFKNQNDIIVSSLSSIAKHMKFTDKEIMEAHKNKYEKNLKRIGGEWN